MDDDSTSDDMEDHITDTRELERRGKLTCAKIIQFTDGIVFITDYSISSNAPDYDITIKCMNEDSTSISCYFWRKLLCIHSRFFACMFNSNMKEKNTSEMECLFNHKTVNLMLNFIYFICSGKLSSIQIIIEEFSCNETVIELLEMAEQYQIPTLMKIIDAYLTEHHSEYIDPDSFNSLEKFKDLHNFIKVMIKKVIKNPQLILSCKNITELTCESIELFSHHEITYYTIILAWVKGDRNTNKQYLPRLITDELIVTSKQCSDDLLSEIAEYCDDQLQLKILRRIADHYIAYRKLINSIVPAVEIDRVDGSINSSSTQKNGKFGIVSDTAFT